MKLTSNAGLPVQYHREKRRVSRSKRRVTSKARPPLVKALIKIPIAPDATIDSIPLTTRAPRHAGP